ncbi:MAG: M20/M25/M40 family metallo-hydrolase [Actinomycetota bacterium]
MSARIDSSWIEETLVELLRSDTQVPFGETEIEAGDPRIVSVVDEVLLPRIEQLGPQEIRRHDMGDVAARFGPDGADGLLIQTYIVSQHANLMESGVAGDVVDGTELGLEGPSALGQGASQNKGPMAAALAGVAARPEELRRSVWLAVNTEGRSSHSGSKRVIDDLGVTAASGIVAFGTDLRVSLGNRGRVDIEVRIPGESSHSSQPWLGRNPIEAAADVVVAARSAPVPEADERLGPATATPYQFACYPVAPHTIPEEVRIVIDRRLLPGETPHEAVESFRAHLGAAGLSTAEVEAGVEMFPAVVDESLPVVRALIEGVRRGGREPATFWSLNAFDAGYACSKGIPTPMFGPGKRSFSGPGLVGTDAVALGDCALAAQAIAHTIAELCG